MSREKTEKMKVSVVHHWKTNRVQTDCSSSCLVCVIGFIKVSQCFIVHVLFVQRQKKVFLLFHHTQSPYQTPLHNKTPKTQTKTDLLIQAFNEGEHAHCHKRWPLHDSPVLFHLLKDALIHNMTVGWRKGDRPPAALKMSSDLKCVSLCRCT